MRYYCNLCGCESYIPERIEEYYPMCPAHPEIEMELIPDYETPEQYQKRTGEPYPNDGPVWFRLDRVYADFTWGICRYITAKRDHDICVCANGPKAPPDDWRPEEDV